MKTRQVNMTPWGNGGTRPEWEPTIPHPSPRRRPAGRPGFSLIELIVVLLVAVVLTGMMLPALHKVRENVHRVVCGSNLRQLGIGMTIYMNDYDRLPASSFLVPNEVWMPHELMASHTGEGPKQWDGLGWLFFYEYCGSAACFYCPSHHGNHPFERYAGAWTDPGDETIYINYHYSGHRDWEDGRIRFLTDLSRMVIATDGLRTASDFNHLSGLNMLRGDGSVRWTHVPALKEMLPANEGELAPIDGDMYNSIWGEIERFN